MLENAKEFELEAAVNISQKIMLSGNVTFSQNKAINFNEYIDDYDQGTQVVNTYKTSDIAFSPNLIAAGRISWKPIKGLEFTYQTKYVGRQFLDNTSRADRSLNPFCVNDLIASYAFDPKFFKEIRVNFMLNNFLNAMYCPNGYTYSFVSGGSLQTYNYYYPQAGRNFMCGVTFKF